MKVHLLQSKNTKEIKWAGGESSIIKTQLINFNVWWWNISGHGRSFTNSFEEFESGDDLILILTRRYCVHGNLINLWSFIMNLKFLSDQLVNNFEMKPNRCDFHRILSVDYYLPRIFTNRLANKLEMKPNKYDFILFYQSVIIRHGFSLTDWLISLKWNQINIIFIVFYQSVIIRQGFSLTE